jgi:hypothetical protein
MDALNAHAHKLAFVGFQVKSHRDRETLKEKLKRYLSTGDWAGVKTSAVGITKTRMFLTTVLTPALSSRRGGNFCRVFEMSCDGIGRMIFRPPETALWFVLSLGRGKR